MCSCSWSPICLALPRLVSAQEKPRSNTRRDVTKIEPPPVATDPSVKLDYDIVYIRRPRRGDDVGTNWAEVSSPLFMDAGADLMLLHPDGKEEVLVAGGKGSVADPMVSLDGEWVYYSLFHDLEDATITDAARAGADIYKIHVKTRKVVRLTHQQFTPNTGAGNWSSDFRTPEARQELHRVRRFQHRPLSIAWRQGRLHQQPQCVSAAQATDPDDAAICHGR